jgi:hypothetical protein
MRLAATMAGGRWQIARADLESFLERLTANALPDEAAPTTPRTRRGNDRERADAARERLRRMGLNV